LLSALWSATGAIYDDHEDGEIENRICDPTPSSFAYAAEFNLKDILVLHL